MKVKYKFVNYGTKAPEHVPGNEYWLDVGGARTKNIYDHHFIDSKFLSTAAIVCANYNMLGKACHDEVEVVLHQTPDLDGIFSSWLLVNILQGDYPALSKNIEELARLVTLHDQGFEDEFPVEESWPIAFYAELETRTTKKEGDEARLMVGHQIIDETVKVIEVGAGFPAIVKRILSPKSVDALEVMRQGYERDICASEKFQISLLDKHNDNKSTVVDGVVFINPEAGWLLKHFARRDKKNSAEGLGFVLLVVSTVVGYQKRPSTQRWRHIISVKPESSVHLKGLGEKLEYKEQEKEIQAGEPLSKGRQRLEKGAGRFGGNVSSPWYNGSGHDFTIIDSPAITIGHKKGISSLLTPDEVFAEIKLYSKRKKYK